MKGAEVGCPLVGEQIHRTMMRQFKKEILNDTGIDMSEEIGKDRFR